MFYPAALPAFALGAGIAFGIFFSVAPLLGVLSLILYWISALLAFVLGRHRFFLAHIALGFAVSGAMLGSASNSAALNAPLGALFDCNVPPHEYQLSANIEGLLRADAARGPNGVTLNIDVDRIEFECGRRATVGGAIIGVGGALASNRAGEWRAGRRVRLAATLRRPAKYLGPGVPDAQRGFGWRGTSLVGSAKSDQLVEVVSRDGRLSEALASIRAGVRVAVASGVAPWSERSAAVVVAILIGDRAGLDEDMQRQLQEAGTYYVIAISGGNIAILAGLCMMVLRLLSVGPRSSALLIIVTLAAYALVVGGGPSVGRATLMAVLYFLAQFGDHRSQPGNVAAVAAATLFSVNPLDVVNTSFALTFGATLGLLVGMPMFPRPRTMRRWIYGGGARCLRRRCVPRWRCCQSARAPPCGRGLSRISVSRVCLRALRWST